MHALRVWLLLQWRRSGVLPLGQLEREWLPHLHAVHSRDLLHYAGRNILLLLHPLRGRLLQPPGWEHLQGSLPCLPPRHWRVLAGSGEPGSLHQLPLGQVLWLKRLLLLRPLQRWLLLHQWRAAAVLTWVLLRLCGIQLLQRLRSRHFQRLWRQRLQPVQQRLLQQCCCQRVRAVQPWGIQRCFCQRVQPVPRWDIQWPWGKHLHAVQRWDLERCWRQHLRTVQRWFLQQRGGLRALRCWHLY